MKKDDKKQDNKCSRADCFFNKKLKCNAVCAWEYCNAKINGNLNYQFRWYKSIDRDGFYLQFRQIIRQDNEVPQFTEWEDIPYILEGVGKI